MKPVVFATKLTYPLKEIEFSLLFKLIDGERKNKILSQKIKKKADLSLVANALAKHALSTTFNIPLKELYFFETDKGKPYLQSHKNTHFNISHSGEYAVCAVSDVPVGIDIQKRVPFNSLVANRIFSPQQLKEISDSKDKDAAFCRIWTKHEACAKLTGAGYAQIKNIDEQLILQSFLYDGYYISVAAANDKF